MSPKSSIIFCSKLKQEAPALESQPFPGTLGEKIFQNISKTAWNQWLSHQTMLINEYRLNLIDPQSKSFLKDEMDKFLFGDGSEKPEGYEPIKKN